MTRLFPEKARLARLPHLGDGSMGVNRSFKVTSSDGSSQGAITEVGSGARMVLCIGRD